MCNLRTRGPKRGKSLDLALQIEKEVRSKFTESPCHKSEGGKLLRKISNINFWNWHTHTHLCVHKITHTHTLQNNNKTTTDYRIHLKNEVKLHFEKSETGLCKADLKVTKRLNLYTGTTLNEHTPCAWHWTC